MKKRYFYLITITVLAVFLLNSCSSEVTETEGADYLLASYYMMAGEETPLADSGTDRASVPSHTFPAGTLFSTLIANGALGNQENNYPEQGQKTYYTVTSEAAGISSYKDKNDATVNGTFNVYFISARTEYPRRENVLDYTLEEYYIIDRDPGDTAASDGEWTSWDIIAEKVNNVWTENNMARSAMEVHFQDGSVREEWIVADTSDSSGYYAHFDIDGDMTIPENPDWAPAGGTDMSWSSEVRYYQKINNWVSYWYKENKEVFGVRYYTESSDDNGTPGDLSDDKYTKTSLAYERIINRETVSSDEEATFNMLMDLLFGPDENRDPAGTTTETLAETVIRYEILHPNKKTVKTVTTVVPTFGDSFTIEEQTSYTQQ